MTFDARQRLRPASGGGGEFYLHVLHGARLRHAQHVEQLQDQLLNVLQGVLLGLEVGVDLLLHLNTRKDGGN